MSWVRSSTMRAPTIADSTNSRLNAPLIVTPASTSFVIITLLFCIILVIIHVFILFADAAVSEALSSTINAAEISPATYSYRDPGTEIETLLLCHQVPEFAGDTAVANPCNISIPISTHSDTGFRRHFPEIVRSRSWNGVSASDKMIRAGSAGQRGAYQG